MNITEKITKDINNFKTAPTSFNTPETNTTVGSGINMNYLIALVVGIAIIFGLWFAWDWYNHHKMIKKTESDEKSDAESSSATSQQPAESSGNIPEVVTTMSPMMYAKYKNDQSALETALNQNPTPKKQDYVVEDSTISAIQSKFASNAGWCYIGEENGYGSCLKVDENQFCMSGHIYPSESMCRKEPK